MKILNLNTKKKDFSKLLQDRINIRDDINHKTENFVRKVIADIKKKIKKFIHQVLLLRKIIFIYQLLMVDFF